MLLCSEREIQDKTIALQRARLQVYGSLKRTTELNAQFQINCNCHLKLKTDRGGGEKDDTPVSTDDDFDVGI